ncbi:AfsR/SARP family transcriptional regulator [Flexivirga alba]|uniref:BTAD domain-containing putative transcriptional regulator n=1 Tax=Flexivirga alba TaxID=702742 RepID=A0ABW2AG99_9MICO
MTAQIRRVRTPNQDRVEEQVESFDLRLLGAFDLRISGQLVPLPLNARRVLALLAVRGRPQVRTNVAYTLWIDTTQSRAMANLRSTLWKIGPQRDRLLTVCDELLWLAPEVHVDLIRVVGNAKRLIARAPDAEVECADVDELAADLLPDWDDEWLQDERERLRQLRVHALEALCTRLGSGGRGAEAVCAGQAAVAAEPLRESAQQLLITAHLAEGNVYEARRQYEIFRRLLWENLQLSPSPQLSELVSATRG